MLSISRSSTTSDTGCLVGVRTHYHPLGMPPVLLPPMTGPAGRILDLDEDEEDLFGETREQSLAW